MYQMTAKPTLQQSYDSTIQKLKFGTEIDCYMKNNQKCLFHLKSSFHSQDI